MAESGLEILKIEDEIPLEKLETYLEGKQIKTTGDALFGTDPKAALAKYHKSKVLLHWKGLVRQNPTAVGGDTKVKSQLDEELGKVYSNMAACHLRLNNYQRTIETADQALALNKDNYKALFRKAKALGEQGFFEKAEPMFNELLQKNPVEAPTIKAELEALRIKDKERERRATNKLRGFLNNKDIFDAETRPTAEGEASTSEPARIEEVKDRVFSLIDYLIQSSDAATHPEIGQVTQSGIKEVLRNHLIRDSDSQAYRDLLTGSIVAESGVKRDLRLQMSTPSSSIVEVGPAYQLKAHPTCIHPTPDSLIIIKIIERAHARLFARSRKPSNVITTGYRSAELLAGTSKGGAGGARQGVTNFFVNTLVTALQAPEWCLLLKRVGDSIILHLLTETSVYIALPNDCYCQIIGPPLLYSVPPESLPRRESSKKDNSHEVDTRWVLPRKRKRTDEDTGSFARAAKRRRKSLKPSRSPGIKNDIATLIAKNCSAAKIPIARATVFYARAPRRTNSGQVRLGLPPDHVLNRMEMKGWRISKGLLEPNGSAKTDLRPDDRNGASEARHLAKYIFPFQYGLENVFSFHAHRLRNEIFSRFKLMNRENEIDRKGACKTPARLKGVLPVLSQLYNRHTKCGYKSLLNRICPSKLRADYTDTKADSSAILELISENAAEELQTQMNYTMSTMTARPTFGRQGRGSVHSSAMESLSKVQSQVKLKPKFAEFICSYAEVYLYVCVVTKSIIPHSLWGCEKNRKMVFSHVMQLICNRRNEVMTLHSVMQGISTNECDWLLPPKPSHDLKQSEAEMLKRRELLQEFIFWYFDQFLLPLLRTTFYITDSSAYRNRVLYFRQDDWDVLCRPLLDRLAATTFERIHQHEAEELLQQRKLGYSFVRLLPKESGVRPIVNLRRKRKSASDSPFDQGQSINQILSAAFQILGYEQRMQAEKLGASVFGPNETYLRLKEFKAKIADESGKLPKLYFVKVDVQACFDTIEQSKLLGILKDLITEDVYMIQKYGQITPAAGRLQRKFVRKAMPEYEHPHFLSYARQLAGLLRHAIFVDQVVYPFAFRDEIIQLLEDHITTNIVKIGEDYYRQRVGIPQGSVLSTLLCSFFYGDLERNVLDFVADTSKRNVLLRLIDDFLFITTDMGDARHFLEVMNQGHPEYGCFISREKTLTNFEHHVGDISQHSLSTVMHPDRKLFPWCGYLIHTEDLSIMADYSRFHDNYLTDSLTIERSRRPNTAFLHKMLQISNAKTHAIFTDTAHNSPRAVRVNVYQAFVLTAMKMHAYIRAVRLDGGLAFVPHARSAESDSGDRDLCTEVIPERDTGNIRSIAGRKTLRTEGAFLLKVIRHCIRYTYASIRNKTLGKLARESGGKCDLTQDEVTWLGTHAFHSILSIKRTVYAHAGVLGALHADLVHPRSHSVKRRLATVARESLQNILRDIRF
ncbi:EST2 [Sanghuangporus sanghuang]